MKTIKFFCVLIIILVPTILIITGIFPLIHNNSSYSVLRMLILSTGLGINTTYGIIIAEYFVMWFNKHLK